MGGSSIGSTSKSEGLISGGRGKAEKSPIGGRVISVCGGKGGRLNSGGGGIVSAGKFELSPIPGIREGGIAKGATGKLLLGSGRLAAFGMSEVSSWGYKSGKRDCCSGFSSIIETSLLPESLLNLMVGKPNLRTNK